MSEQCVRLNPFQLTFPIYIGFYLVISSVISNFNNTKKQNIYLEK